VTRLEHLVVDRQSTVNTAGVHRHLLTDVLQHDYSPVIVYLQ